MTLPTERSSAIWNTREFLRSLLDSKQTPKLPKSIRSEAAWCLKHFPTDADMKRAMKKCPEVFGSKTLYFDENEHPIVERKQNGLFQMVYHFFCVCGAWGRRLLGR